MADDSAPKLQIDSDWKAEAQREKERLSEKEKSKPAKPAKSGPGGAAGAGGAPGMAGAGMGGAGGPHEGELPEASFKSLVGMLASQAIMGLGAMADEKTGRVVVDLEGSRFAIDLLDVLEQKTKGNLEAEEAKELTAILAELRSRYVQINNLVAKQMAQQAAAAMASPPGGPGAGGFGAGMPPLKM